MRTTYCDGWSILKKSPWKSIDKATALENHNSKVPYTAIIHDDDNNVTHVIEITKEYVLVYFMNKFTSPYLIYDFEVKDNNDIFLTAVSCNDYDEKSNEKLGTIDLSFEENGDIFIAKWDRITGEFVELENKADTKPNWDKFPEFGKYDHLLVEER